VTASQPQGTSAGGFTSEQLADAVDERLDSSVFAILADRLRTMLVALEQDIPAIRLSSLFVPSPEA
jgi:hypothetical protein